MSENRFPLFGIMLWAERPDPMSKALVLQGPRERCRSFRTYPARIVPPTKKPGHLAGLRT